MLHSKYTKLTSPFVNSKCIQKYNECTYRFLYGKQWKNTKTFPKHEFCKCKVYGQALALPPRTESLSIGHRQLTILTSTYATGK